MVLEKEYQDITVNESENSVLEESMGTVFRENIWRLVRRIRRKRAFLEEFQDTDLPTDSDVSHAGLLDDQW